MRIQGSQCPHCYKEFTADEVDNMYFVCPSCLSDKIEVLTTDIAGKPNFGVAIAKAKYSAIIDLVQLTYNPNNNIVFLCKDCSTKFNSTNFYLIHELNNSEINKKKGSKISNFFKKLFS